jgi:outer membrane protein OmpA-like peptidoglycan-associated protein
MFILSISAKSKQKDGAYKGYKFHSKLFNHVTHQNQNGLFSYAHYMMRSIQFILFLTLTFTLASQPFRISGQWSGILKNTADETATTYAVILDHKAITNYTKGKLKIESEKGFVVYEVAGPYQNPKDFKLSSSKKPISNAKGPINSSFYFQFSYQDTSGYIISKFNAPGSTLDGYTLYLERDSRDIWTMNTLTYDAFFINAFSNNIKNGIPARDKRMAELANFQFKPVYFETDQYALDTAYYDDLKAIARILKSHSDLRLKIEGHTDGDGSESYNLTLSKQRAEEIIKYLVSIGIPPDRMVQAYDGEKKPIDSNLTEEGKQRNRRVELSFI